MGKDGEEGSGGKEEETGYVGVGEGGQTIFIDSIKSFTNDQTYPANASLPFPTPPSPPTPPQASRAPPRKPSLGESPWGIEGPEADGELSGEASAQYQTSEGDQTASTPSSDDEFWKPVAPSGRLRKRRSSPGPIFAPAAASPSRFISLLSSSSSAPSSGSSSSGASTSCSDSDNEVTVVRSRRCQAGVLKRKFQEALEPEGRVGRRVRLRLRERDRGEWSTRDRGVLAEALQDGLDFRKVGEMLGREADDVFGMFSKVISATLLHAPSRRERGTQTE